MENTNPVEKLNKGVAAVYSVGGMGGAVAWYMINNYLNLFYTDVVGLSATAISLIMLIARIWDAVNDPMMGAIVDRTQTKWGKFRPWLFIAPPFLAIFNVLTFTVWPLEGAAKAAACLICYIGAGMAYTVYNVSYNGIVNRLAKNSQHKMDIISISQVASAFMQTLLGALVMPMILKLGNSDVPNAKGYFITVGIISVVTIPLIWVCAVFCKEVTTEPIKNLAENAAKQAGEKQKHSLVASAKALFKNSQLMIAVLNVFLGAMASIARMSMLSYYIIYVAGSYQLIAIVYPLITAMQLVSNLVLPFFTRKVGKTRWFVILTVVQAISMGILFVLPPTFGIILVCTIITGLTMGNGSMCYGMICDSVEYGDWKFGVRDDGLAFSFMSFGVKLATAITGSVGILLLQATGYVPQAQQSASTQTGISFVVNMLPAILTLLSAATMIWYKLDEKKMAEITAELEERRAAQEK